MNALYPRLQETARRLIASYGRPASIIRSGPATGPGFDPRPAPSTLYPCMLVEVDEMVSNRLRDLVKQGHKGVIISSAAAVRPGLGDRISIDGEMYQISGINPVSPGGLTLMYEAALST